MRRFKAQGLRLKALIMGLWIIGCSCVIAAERQTEVVIVRGADGTAEYGKRFDEQVAAWQEACTKGLVRCEVLTKIEELQARLEKAAPQPNGALWLVMIGHGTFDGREAKFNLEGPDFSAEQLAGLLSPIQREVIVVNTASASGAFVKPLSGPKRVIVSATKSASEVFYPRFGEFMAKAIGGLPEADVDQDKQVSLLEAFLYAAKQAAQFYETEQRIATEHALIEDNGDGVGTRPEMFEAVRAKDDKADGARALQLALVLNEQEMKLSDEVRAKRDALEAQVRALVSKKAQMKDDDYYHELEALFVQIARLGLGAP